MDALSFMKNRVFGYDVRYRNLKKSDKLNMDFVLKKLSARKGDNHAFLSRGIRVPPFACRFSTVPGGENILAVANEDGHIFLMDSKKKSGKRYITHWRAHDNAVFDIQWLSGKPQIISAGGDNAAVLWDVCTKKTVNVFLGHRGTIRCIDVSPVQNAVFATGARDGTVRIWDSRCNMRGNFNSSLDVISMANCDLSSKTRQNRTVGSQCDSSSKTKQKCIGGCQTKNNHQTSVASLAFQTEYNLFASGVTDGLIKVWDLRKTYSIYKKQPLPKYQLFYDGPKIHGFVNLVFDSCYKYLYASCTDNKIYCYDCHTYKSEYVRTYAGCKTSYFVKLAISNDDEYLLSGSSDEKGYIWKTSKPGHPIVQLSGHTDEVTAVAWNRVDFAKLVTCGDDLNLFFWKINEEQLRSFNDHDSVYAEPFNLSTGGTQEIPQKQSDPSISVENPPQTQHHECSISLPNLTSTTTKKQKPCSSSVSITQWFSPSAAEQCDVPQIEMSTVSERCSGIQITVTSGKKESEETGVAPVSLESNYQVLTPNKIRNDDNASALNSIRRVLNLDISAAANASTRNIDEQNLPCNNISVMSQAEKENISLEQTVSQKRERKDSSGEISEIPQPDKTLLLSNTKISLKQRSKKQCRKEQSGGERKITSYFTPPASKPKD